MTNNQTIEMKPMFSLIQPLVHSRWASALSLGKPKEAIVGFSLIQESGINHEFLSRVFHGILGILETPKTPTVGEKALGCPRCPAFLHGVPRPYQTEDGKSIKCWELESSNNSPRDELPCLTMIKKNRVILEIKIEES